jgi:hypothetical protein
MPMQCRPPAVPPENPLSPGHRGVSVFFFFFLLCLFLSSAGPFFVPSGPRLLQGQGDNHMPPREIWLGIMAHSVKARALMDGQAVSQMDNDGDGPPSGGRRSDLGNRYPYSGGLAT